jgi:hypothetical protein
MSHFLPGDRPHTLCARFDFCLRNFSPMKKNPKLLRFFVRVFDVMLFKIGTKIRVKLLQKKPLNYDEKKMKQSVDFCLQWCFLYVNLTPALITVALVKRCKQIT